LSSASATTSLFNVTQSANHESRLLIVRFSSFGDIVQCFGVARAFKSKFRSAQVDWLTRLDFVELVNSQTDVDHAIGFSRQSSLTELILMSWQLSKDYTHLYDAHNNLRSAVVRVVFRFRALMRLLTGGNRIEILTRSKMRIARFLFFRFRRPTLAMPFQGADSFHSPLVKWGLPGKTPAEVLLTSKQIPSDDVVIAFHKLRRPVIALAPSAAWAMKRWPPGHFLKLMELLPHASFALLGGPEDAFIAELCRNRPAESCLDLHGRLTLTENAWILERADLVVANDTGLLHLADQMERPTIALIGPTAMGYPSHKSSRVAEISLSCKPCSKDGSGACINSVYQRCLKELLPQTVAQMADQILMHVKHQVPK
jgi:ADP-heptose:LPS heptosyltransferase